MAGGPSSPVRVVLSGPMGAGKSTLGPLLAERLGARFVDLDALVESRVGRSVSTLFREEGEAAFRAHERAALECLLGEPGPLVVALGGGTVCDAALRRRLLDETVVVTLHAPLATLRARVGAGADRPLASHLDRLLTERAAAYAECHVRLDTSALGPERLAAELQTWLAQPPLVVPLGTRSYRVHVARGLLGRLRRLVELDSLEASGWLVVTDEHVASWADRVGASLPQPPLAQVRLKPGESHKTIGSVERIWDAALEVPVDRDGVLAAVGGGTVLDVSGMAAATFLRGVRWMAVPTSLLAMLDAAVGGKTGIDRPQGKNLVGVVHQPSLVVADVDVLGTLPDAERRAALAEAVKTAWLEGEQAVAALERDAEALVAADPDATIRAVRAALRVKARLVAEDEHDRGLRRRLNLGHTVGHALEAATVWRLRHGEAVALGLLAAMRVGRARGLARPHDEARLRELLGRLGLPVELDAWLSPDVLRHVRVDKKRRGDRIGFVVPGSPGHVETMELSPDELAAALSR
ncbi:MAG: bifunctional shikimate kinase/3-dehydroquinate synthase [Myxococcales bacterium]|nr:bifunctional shikimate kinase/3-dehydroquinate synthase [Myxococcales bacterium]